jgi:L-threonylcarbamoyladenylate synthase
VEALRRGGVVGVPTETVYGLAGNAFNPRALVKIFESKERPLSDPLIVHLPEAGWLERVVRFSSVEQRDLVERLAASFWPGPLTLLLPRHPDLPELVTAGSDLVAVRVTAHPLFQQVIRGVDSPLAAPSANRFGSISPTSAEDVRIELGEFIGLILDGGPCDHGVESTIVSLENQEMVILRPGPITEYKLIKYGHITAFGTRVKTPGSLPGHYAPKKELHILNTDIKEDQIPSNAGYLAFTEPSEEIRSRYSVIEVLSPSGDLREAAANFYGALRRLDSSNVDIIHTSSLPEVGIGVAIMDRMRRASHGSRYKGTHQ